MHCLTSPVRQEGKLAGMWMLQQVPLASHIEALLAVHACPSCLEAVRFHAMLLWTDPDHSGAVQHQQSMPHCRLCSSRLGLPFIVGLESRYRYDSIAAGVYVVSSFKLWWEVTVVHR